MVMVANSWEEVSDDKRLWVGSDISLRLAGTDSHISDYKHLANGSLMSIHRKSTGQDTIQVSVSIGPNAGELSSRAVSLFESNLKANEVAWLRPQASEMTVFTFVAQMAYYGSYFTFVTPSVMQGADERDDPGEWMRHLNSLEAVKSSTVLPTRLGDLMPQSRTNSYRVLDRFQGVLLTAATSPLSIYYKELIDTIIDLEYIPTKIHNMYQAITGESLDEPQAMEVMRCMLVEIENTVCDEHIALYNSNKSIPIYPHAVALMQFDIDGMNKIQSRRRICEIAEGISQSFGATVDQEERTSSRQMS